MKLFLYYFRHNIWVCLLITCTLQANEPEQCGAIKPPKQAMDSLAHWLLEKGSWLKQRGCWKKHLELGAVALKQADKIRDARSIMLLCVQMASSSFYLGDYDHSLKLAESALKSARQQKDSVAETEALYLLSAIARAKGQPAAVTLAEQALSVLQKNMLDDPVLEGKVYFNFGAALSDTYPQQLSQSKKYLQQAYLLFVANKRNGDAFRTGLRWTRVEYLQGHYEEALKLLRSLTYWIEGPRLQMLYDFQLAKVLHRLQRWQEADDFAHNALKLAKRLDAVRDRERIERLLEVIRKKSFLPDSDVLQK